MDSFHERENKEFINSELSEYMFMMRIMLLVLLAIALMGSAIIIQNIMQPIKKLSKNLDEIIEGKADSIKNITNNKVSNEIYDLADKFKILAQKLNNNLQEISSQKSQMETILLHMSDEPQIGHPLAVHISSTFCSNARSPFTV